MQIRPSFLVMALTLAAGPGCATPPASSSAADASPAFAAAAAEGDGIGHAILMYLPNRIFDVLDIVRARVRVGPGLGITLRATELADLKLGAWTSIFVGLRGPRLEPSIPWPFGFDSYAGAGVSFVEAESDDYQYGKGEFGVGLHLLLVGVDVGIDPLELGDFVLGLLTIDIIDDDY